MKTISLFFISLLILVCYKSSLESEKYSKIGKGPGKTEKTTMTLIFYPNSTAHILFKQNDSKGEFLLKYKVDKNFIISFSEKIEPSIINFIDKDTIKIRPLKDETRVFIDLIYVIEFKREPLESGI